jgi:anti-sigma factor RsiW
MTDRHPRDLLGAYADGELPPAQMADIARHLELCTECAREVALIKTMGGAMRTMVATTPPRGIWNSVHRRISRPLGWILVIAGVSVWAAMAVLEWFRSRELSWEWLTFSAVAIGGVLLAVSVAYEQYRGWKETRYKDVEL